VGFGATLLNTPGVCCWHVLIRISNNGAGLTAYSAHNQSSKNPWFLDSEIYSYLSLLCEWTCFVVIDLSNGTTPHWYFSLGAFCGVLFARSKLIGI